MLNLIKKIFKLYPSNEKIFEAAKRGDKSILKLPKEKLIIKDKYGWIPLHWLAFNKVKEILSLDKSLLKIMDDDGETPIHYLADKGVKEILKLDKSLLIIKNNNGDTPIHWLARRGVEIPEELKQYI